jgi:hypothetical protein
MRILKKCTEVLKEKMYQIARVPRVIGARVPRVIGAIDCPLLKKI